MTLCLFYRVNVPFHIKSPNFATIKDNNLRLITTFFFFFFIYEASKQDKWYRLTTDTDLICQVDIEIEIKL